MPGRRPALATRTDNLTARATEVGMTIEPFAPMLAARGEPFDSAEYLFEVRGFRLLGQFQTANQKKDPTVHVSLVA